MNPTRMFPRTLSQAFADVRASAIEPPTEDERRQRRAENLVTATCLAALIALAVMAVCGWLPGGAA